MSTETHFATYTAVQGDGYSGSTTTTLPSPDSPKGPTTLWDGILGIIAHVFEEIRLQCVYGPPIAAAACARVFSTVVSSRPFKESPPIIQATTDTLVDNQFVVDHIATSLLESCSAVAHTLLYTIDLEPLGPKTFSECDTNSPPVILVHGFMGASGSWVYQRELLLKAGIGNVFAVNLGLPFHSIEEYTEKLSKKVRHVRDITKQNSVILVGHSMGGIVCRQYRQTQASKDSMKVLSIIAMASPFAGTQAAESAVWFSASARQILPRSPLLEMQQAWKCEDDQTVYVNILSKADTTVTDQAAFDGHEGNMRIERVSKVGHTCMMFSEEVGRSVIYNIRLVQTRFQTKPLALVK